MKPNPTLLKELADLSSTY